MPIKGYPRKAVVAAPNGLAPALKAKSRTRRERQRALAEIADHSPKRRNDLLPQLAVSDVPPKPHNVNNSHATFMAEIRGLANGTAMRSWLRS